MRPSFAFAAPRRDGSRRARRRRAVSHSAAHRKSAPSAYDACSRSSRAASSRGSPSSNATGGAREAVRAPSAPMKGPRADDGRPNARERVTREVRVRYFRHEPDCSTLSARTHMKPNVVFSYFIATVLAGCHSASWTPPEPQQAPAASATPPAAGTEPAPTTAPASLPPTEPASASATPDSTTTAAAAPVDTSTAAAPSAAPPSTGGKATAKTETHKVEAHKSEDAPDR